MSDKLLLQEAPASVFQPRLAAWIGLNESIVLQHVHYLAGRGEFGATVDGVKWIRMTTEEWAQELPCFDPHTIRRTLDNLEKDTLIISRTFSGRSKWYRVNYELLTTIDGPVERLQSRTKARVKANKKAKEAKHNVTVQNGHIDNVSVQNGQLQLSKMDTSSVQNGQLPRPLPRPLSENILPNGNSGETPQEGRKWDKVSKGIVGDRFIELTGLKIPTNQKTRGAWWGWLYELFEISNKDPAEACRIMAVVVSYMRHKNLTISSPKSLINLSRAVASGQNLNGVNSEKPTSAKYGKPPPNDRSEPGTGTPTMADKIAAALESKSRRGGPSP